MRGTAGIMGLQAFVQPFDPSSIVPGPHSGRQPSIRVNPGVALSSGSRSRQPLPTLEDVPWRTKVGGARIVEHRSKASADRAIAEARQRYGSGVRSMRIVRVIDPDGNLRIIDFATEEAMNRPELAAVVQARQERDRAQAAAKEAAAQ